MYGFTEVSRREAQDIGATLVEYRHDKCGTKLLHIIRDDPNRTFMISFKTPPKDDTGVFHIIEHSVLCGSKKFPMKEPFLELLKGSLNTFLNAMTYPDKTVYPVCSINDKDFLNLVDVYMDAVLNPAFYQNENIFMQEGHHREINEDGELTENGVVLNEMKGAFSSPDEIEMFHLMRHLFPDTPYAKCSGGAPESIPKLTYGEFLEAHKKHYHPSGAYIILDGSINVHEVFPLLNEHLCAFDRANCDVQISDIGARVGATVRDSYSIAVGEDAKNKTRLTLALGGFDFSEKRKNMALSLIKSVIAEDNSSVFSKKMLDSGLCEDVALYSFDSMKYGANALSFLNVKDEKEDALTELALKTLRSIALDGLDKNALNSALSAMEFKTREADYGRLPSGIIYALSVMESWLYSENYWQGLKYEDEFRALRELIDTDYYDKLLLSIIPEEKDAIRIVLTPSDTAEAEGEAREREYMKRELLKMSEEDKLELQTKCERFKLWQATPDTPENLATLPSLSVSDVDPVAKKPVVQELQCGENTVLSVPIQTNRITYLSLLFDASFLNEEESTLVSIASMLLTRVDTKKHKANELKNIIKEALGYFTVAPVSVSDTSLNPLFYIKVGVGVASDKRMKAVEIIKEVLTETIFPPEDIKRIVLQSVLNYKQSVIADGTELAITRVQAHYDKSCARQEHLNGYESYKRLVLLAEKADNAQLWDELSDKLRSLFERLFIQSNLTVCIGGDYDSELARELINMLPAGKKPEPYNIKLLKLENEGAAIPTKVSYAVTGMPLPEHVGADIKVVRGIVEFEYLWGEIRTGGGAYGAGEILRDGFVGFYSYRDPSPERTLKKYEEIPRFLRSFADECGEMDRYIIGTVARLDAPKSPRLTFELEIMQKMCGVDYEKIAQNRKEILSANRDSILKFADILEEKWAERSTCVVSSADILKTIPHLTENILEIV